MTLNMRVGSMHYTYRKKRWLLVLVFLAIVMIPVHAATDNLTANPAKLTIFTTSGDSVTRTILLMNNVDAPITHLNVIPLDLDRTDNQAVYSAQNIGSPSIDRTIPEKGVLTVPVTFTTNNGKSGEYSGSLLITTNNDKTVIPIILKIKDSPLWAWIIAIVFGVVGWFLVYYKTILLKPNQLDNKRRNLIRLYKNSELYRNKDPDTDPYTSLFREKIEYYLSETKNALGSYDLSADEGNLKKAEESFNSAEKIWKNWADHKEPWKRYLEHTTQARNKIKEINAEIEFGSPQLTKDIEDQLRESWETSVEEEFSKSPLKELFEKINNKLSTFSLAIKLVKELEILCNEEKDPSSSPSCKKIVEKFKESILTIQYSTDDALKKLPEEIEKEIAQYSQKKSGRLVAYRHVDLPVNIVAQQPIPIDDEPISSVLYDKNLEKIYFVIKMIVIPITFVVFGIYLQYYQNPIFGVNGVVDYITLAFWAFGVTPATDSVTKIADFMK